MFPYPTLSDAAPYGKYIVGVVRKTEEFNRQKFIKSCHVVSGAMLKTTIGEPDDEVVSPAFVQPASVDDSKVIALESDSQVLSVLSCLEEADDNGPEDVRALGLLGNAGRALVGKLVQQALKAALENLDLDQIIKSLLGGLTATQAA